MPLSFIKDQNINTKMELKLFLLQSLISTIRTDARSAATQKSYGRFHANEFQSVENLQIEIISKRVDRHIFSHKNELLR